MIIVEEQGGRKEVWSSPLTNLYRMHARFLSAPPTIVSYRIPTSRCVRSKLRLPIRASSTLGGENPTLA